MALEPVKVEVDKTYKLDKIR